MLIEIYNNDADDVQASLREMRSSFLSHVMGVLSNTIGSRVNGIELCKVENGENEKSDRIVRCLKMIQSLLENTEQNGLYGINLHGSQSCGEKITINVTYNDAVKIHQFVLKMKPTDMLCSLKDQIGKYIFFE